MTVPLPILKHGSCEPLKAVVHGASLGLCALMAIYNGAAWINRRERHLAINALVYGLGVAWEQRLVTHHLLACRDLDRAPLPVSDMPECCEQRRAA